MQPTTAALTAWLDTAINHELRGDFAAIKLERIRAFLGLIPVPTTTCIVAGTKGKGSTLRLIEAALVAHGVPTLAFTSPHVLDVCERWRIDGHNADPTTLTGVAEQVAALETAHHLPLTWFERTFAMACLLANQRPNTVFLVEVGLGGRLDCANVLDATVAVLTHLSHDHRDVLGPTLTHIAREKIAISRPGRPLVIAPQSADGAAAVATALAELPAAPAVHHVVRHADLPELALPGAHQCDNASTALVAARLLFPALDDARALAAMATATLPARCQLVTQGGRRILIDGAHNGPSLAATLAVAEARLRPGWRLVMGLAKDKEIDEIAAVLGDRAFVRCGYQSPRARGEADWPEDMRRQPWAHTAAAALATIPANVDVCVTGSFYIAGELLAYLG
jgi:dihydrofolate synthase/folylpolyglutamate synthase